MADETATCCGSFGSFARSKLRDETFDEVTLLLGIERGEKWLDHLSRLF